MNNVYYILAFLFFIYFFILKGKRERKHIAAHIHLKKKRKDREKMFELAKNFIGKECLVYTINESQVEGVIKEISGGALLIENKGSTEAVNLDYVIRIREYPRNKNGKKKSVVLD